MMRCAARMKNNQVGVVPRKHIFLFRPAVERLFCEQQPSTKYHDGREGTMQAAGATGASDNTDDIDTTVMCQLDDSISCIPLQ